MAGVEPERSRPRGLDAEGALADAAATAIARLVTTGAVSAREVLEAHLARLDAHNPALNAVVVPLHERARAQADRVDAARARGLPLGPLAGVPMTVKESFDLAGTASSAGLASRAAARVAADGPGVSALAAAGAVIVGKTNVSQLLLLIESDNPVYGRTENPWAPGRTAGGSSGGEAAAIAAGIAPLGLGTDLGGSVRLPAHYCGVHALKPTSGRMPLRDPFYGLLFPWQDAVTDSGGLIARSVEDLALALHALAPAGPRRRGPIRSLRVGLYVDDCFVRPAPAIRRAVEAAGRALAARGATVVPFVPPDVAEGLALFYALLTLKGAAWARRLLARSPRAAGVRDLMWLVDLPGPVRRAARALAASAGQRYLHGLLDAVDRGRREPLPAVVAAQRRYRARLLEALRAAEVDVLVGPPAATPAYPHGASRFLLSTAVSYTALYNLVGFPAGVVAATRVRADEESDRAPSADLVTHAARRAESGSTGLPVGVQVAAPPGEDDRVLAVMAALEATFRKEPDYSARAAARLCTEE
jgi:fatty acid amide hydrolase